MKKLLSILLCIGLTAGLVPAVSAAETGTTPPTPAAGADVWDGSTEQPTQRVKKGGEDYYEITTCAQLAYVAQTGGDWLGYNYILANDLILNDVEITWDEDYNCTNADALKKWTPIGESRANSFSGKFDGNGHIIRGLYVDTSDDYAGLFGVNEGGAVFNTTLVNSLVRGDAYVGGFVGEGVVTIKNCVNYGPVIGISTPGNYGHFVGGIAGDCALVTNCVNYGPVVGSSYVGGILGWEGTATGCANYGSVTSYSNAGGIVGDGRGYVSSCVNYGAVTSVNGAAGIMGHNDRNYESSGNDNVLVISGCANYGPVTALSSGSASGIVGHIAPGAIVANCFNCGSLTGASAANGIVTANIAGHVRYCYNVGTLTATEEDNLQGGIIGYGTDYYSRTSTATSCYYTQGNAPSYLDGSDIFGDVPADLLAGIQAKTEAELKNQDTFVGWDFVNDWAMDPAVNDGYPYPVGITPPGLTVAVTGVSLDQTELAMTVGDVVYLAATVAPANADNTACAWTTGDQGVVEVDDYGRLVAVAPGTATVQVTTADGGYCATCAVTVTEPTKDDFELGELILLDSEGNVLPTIPDGGFWAKVPITQNVASGEANVILAAYDDQGRFAQMFLACVSGLVQEQTIQVGFWVKNSGEVAKLKAMAVSSLSEMTPLCPAVEVSR